MLLMIIYIFLALPGVLFPLYYLHGFDNARWFYQFRSLPLTELTAAPVGLFAGAFAELIKDVFSRPFLIVVLILGVLVPYLKPILNLLPADQLSDVWQDGVCRQSTPSSCGAASAATIFRMFGESLTEKDIARECFAYRGGTENWYIARAFRRRGYQINYRIEDFFPSDLRLPAIAGVRVGGAGHFIALIDTVDDVYVTGDPLVGREKVPVREITKRFQFTGFFMEVQEPGPIRDRLNSGDAAEQENVITAKTQRHEGEENVKK